MLAQKPSSGIVLVEASLPLQYHTGWYHSLAPGLLQVHKHAASTRTQNPGCRLEDLKLMRGAPY